jgi:hypothetical protein
VRKSYIANKPLENEISPPRRKHNSGKLEQVKEKLVKHARNLDFWIKIHVEAFSDNWSPWQYDINKYAKHCERYLEYYEKYGE